MAAVVYVGVIVAGILVWAIFAYNRLVHWRNCAEESWHDIDAQLKRRWDLIPNVVNVVKRYASHERGVLENVTRARARALDAGNPFDQAQADEAMKGALFSLFAIAEDYPLLQADESFLKMQHALADAEDAIQRSRRFYNAAVRELNAAIVTFPKNLIAGMFRLESRDFYALPDELQRLAPRISL